ncbi:MAG: hypothetical protein A3G49_02365 [Candidatus Sungbacteria bacterium RIFCSPLOWO2_12_FULL_41_11]|uniref:DUF6922 domain-containing protein n=1 Tax=Candidatus Sungbacteria bacterium RIFCSPLOWO2_12_FULL_41_11 TaxID=1802286 RepID=A0A1G2LNK0_9BACT|nr:MAG: hypothetical protein UV01_C0004G0063 [Parcubacteria group bacterium GW2011_GWA2_42_14]OGZ98131.1 MAG: hypothetical protein A3D41_04075 [Candidatus Sungbacteria bacterium RIFCSPHIGHO2_02_FULL_41_12b]OHA13185.1 MAG: hypothetical protein A3G49_02365 [Candidatus Sungbacteria bacterium RIFCSPLOWO2_12_FULL_41_11]
MKLPPFLHKYFWDVDFKKLDSKADGQYIIERILEYGDEKAVNWLKKNIERRFIVSVLKNCRSLSPQSANFWAVIFRVPAAKVLCLNKSFLERRFNHWIW